MCGGSPPRFGSGASHWGDPVGGPEVLSFHEQRDTLASLLARELPASGSTRFADRRGRRRFR
ncbi:hypothetical protein EJD98_02650 [Mycolicibacterium peregrinum]|uniref:Uncharacterized protein n=1 Tax=Mycolicibacterium peregrinum TaxID=43304 RepID=A0A4Z0HV61_MYCPR|nr:hypothetical protein EJD94_00025 [Mycolicibacterium peregrinum]TGB47819.1 hypothetical protein EJD98_02650 [Mycolicibacterium peregrinum]